MPKRKKSLCRIIEKSCEGFFVFFSFCVIYLLLFPMPLSRVMGAQNEYTVSIIYTNQDNLQTRTKNYENVDSGQTQALTTLAENYSYRRTFRTWFANSISYNGDIEYVITVWEVDGPSNKMLTITSSGQMMIDGHPYKLMNAEEFTKKAGSIFSE